MGNRVAYVGADRQLHVMRVDGSGRHQVTFPRLAGPLSGWGAAEGGDTVSWPCWSPDGRWLACFRAMGDGDAHAPMSVHLAQVDGVEEIQLPDSEGRVPIYAQWSPGGRAIAVLCQEEDELQLWSCHLDDPRGWRPVESGIPLFFSWTDDGHLLVHAGGEDGGRLVRRAVYAQGEDQVFRFAAGAFCTPFPLDDGAVVVAAGDTVSHVTLCDANGEPTRQLAALRGLLAVVPAPDGGAVAFASAPQGEGNPYDGVWLCRLDGSPLIHVIDVPCLAFFWAGPSLVYVTWDAVRGCMWWWLAHRGGGEPRRLAPFWPTRDQLFQIHFFEQYATSHPLVSPDGRSLIYASYADPRSTGGEPGEPGILLVDLAAEDPVAIRIAAGAWAVFAPES